MSGVFSMASHCVLQYLPEVVRQEQTGCAHFVAFSAAIFGDLLLQIYGGSSEL
jgi:hypothetical protein